MTDENNSARIENILGQVRELKKQYERRAAITGEDFNVFEILGVERREVRHSAFLANLLNPKGSHRQGAVFLEHFLNLEPLRLADSSGYGKLYDFQVITEAATNANDGRIDISLKNEGYACIIIENKIDAEDGDGQLNKYYWDARCDEGFAKEQIKLIYLTLDGEPPSKKSLAGQKPLDPDSVVRISYEDHIVEWLEDCLKEVVRVAPVRETLCQYQMQVRKLTGQSINKELTMDIADLIKNAGLIYDLECAVSEAKKRIELELLKFWEKLKERGITEVCSIEKSSEEPQKIIKYTGINFKITSCNRDQSFDIGFRIEIEYPNEVLCDLHSPSKVFYGFILLKRNKQSDKCHEERFKPYVDLVVGGPLSMKKTNKWWLGRKSLEYVPDQLEDLVEKITNKSKIVIDQFRESQQDAGL